jgi:alkyl hydroperoxide reductase subunit AhpF
MKERFDEATWAELPEFLANLPEPVRLIVWGDETKSRTERQAAELVQFLAAEFAPLRYELLPRRVNYDYYPVIGVMRDETAADGEVTAQDHGVRLIGLPEGYQMTAFIAAIQAVAFRGMTLEAKTRIQLKGLQTAVRLELITDAKDEAGGMMAHLIFNLAAANPHIRSHLIMGDQFPEAVWRYSVDRIPHLVINNRRHVTGVIEEGKLMREIAAAVKAEQ